MRITNDVRSVKSGESTYSQLTHITSHLASSNTNMQAKLEQEIRINGKLTSDFSVLRYKYDYLKSKVERLEKELEKTKNFTSYLLEHPNDYIDQLENIYPEFKFSFNIEDKYS